MDACLPWFRAELRLVRPHVLVILRAPDSAAREAEPEAFTRDLAAAVAMLEA